MTEDKRNGALVGGWCCLIIAVILASWQPVTFIIYLPLFLAAFILAIVAIAQRRITGGVVLLLLAIVVPIGAISYGVVSTWHGISEGTHAGASIATVPQSADPASATSSTAQTWHYEKYHDPMGRGTTRIAEIASDNVLYFGAPYEGAQRAELSIVNSAKYGLQARVSIPRGQFDCPSYEGCTVHVRFDDRVLTQMKAAPSDDGDSTILFLLEPKAVAVGVMKAKVFRVEAPFWQEGTQVLTFPVAGLDAIKVLTPPSSP